MGESCPSCGSRKYLFLGYYRPKESLLLSSVLMGILGVVAGIILILVQLWDFPGVLVIIPSPSPSPSLSPTPPLDLTIPHYEIVKKTTPTSTDVIGEILINYPSWIQPGTGESVRIAIQIPRNIELVEVIFGIRVDLPATVTPVIGEKQTQTAMIIIDNRMRVELSSATINLIPLIPLIQDVIIDEPENPTVWIWDITAPEAIGYHLLNVSVFIDEDSDLPSWFGSYQIKVLEPTVIPAPSETPAPIFLASETPNPTVTATLTPTKTFLQAVGESFIEDLVKNIALAVGGIVSAIAIVWRIIILPLKRKDRISQLEIIREKSTKEEKVKIKAELKYLKSIKWWQFWRGSSSKDAL